LKKSVLKILRLPLFLGLALLLLYFAFRGIDLSILWNEILHARYGWILLSLFFGTLAFISRALRWNLLIEALNYKPSFKNTFLSLMVGYLANYAIPRIGEITRCGVLSGAEKIPADKLFGTVIIERIIDMIMVFILLFVLLIGRFDFFGFFLHHNLLIPLWDKLSAFSEKSVIFWLVIIALAVSLFLIIYLVIRAHPGSNPLILRIRKIIKGMISGIQTIYKMKRSWAFILHSLLIWGSYWMMSYVAVFLMPATAGLKLIDGLFILVIGSFGFIAPVQGGIGAFHWIVSVGLTLYGIPKEEGLAFATILHGSQSLWTIFLGFISMLLLFLRRKRMAAENG
jgi:uncharacterized protein (TIRG00374 family)